MSNIIGDLNANAKKKRLIILGLLAVICVIIFVLTAKDEEKTKNPNRIRIYDDLSSEYNKEKYLQEVAPEIKINIDKTKSLETKNQELEKRLDEIQRQLKLIQVEDNKPNVTPTTNTNKYNSYSSYPIPYQNSTTQDTNEDKPNSYKSFSTKSYIKLSDTLVSKQIEDKKKVDEQVLNENKIYLPAGTIIKAKLQSGFNAPTLSNAKSETAPVLFKIVDLAFLPNGYRIDISGGKVIGEAYGYLSTERAKIKINNISFITKDGKYIDLAINNGGYVTGEDGKEGMKGVAVSKQGAILGRAFIAGFIDGMSKIFASQGQTIITSGLGTTTTNSQGLSEKMEGAIFGGLGESTKIATQTYKDLLSNIEPTIEVSANRDADIILTKGIWLDYLKEKKEK